MKCSNTRSYIFYSILKKALPIWFVFLLYLLGKGLSYTEAILLDTFSAVTSLVFEVPSGILADRYSRKKLIIIGEIIIFINFLILLVSSHYVVFVIGALLSGIGDACVSGTGEAFIYDSLLQEKEEDKYLELVSKINKWGFIVVAIATLGSSYLYDTWNELPMVISVVMQAGGVICLLCLKEEKGKKSRQPDKKEKGFRIELSEQIDIIKKIWTTKGLPEIFIIYVIMLEVISNVNYSTQAYLPSLGLSVKYLGCALCVFNIISAFGARFAKRLKMNGKGWIFFYVVVLFLLSTANIYIAMTALICSRFVNGFVWSILSDETNKKVESEDRATILSYQGLFSSIIPLFVDPLIGMSYDRYSFGGTYFGMGVVLLVFCSGWIIKSRISGRFET